MRQYHHWATNSAGIPTKAPAVRSVRQENGRAVGADDVGCRTALSTITSPARGSIARALALVMALSPSKSPSAAHSTWVGGRATAATMRHRATALRAITRASLFTDAVTNRNMALKAVRAAAPTARGTSSGQIVRAKR